MKNQATFSILFLWITFIFFVETVVDNLLTFFRFCGLFFLLFFPFLSAKRENCLTKKDINSYQQSCQQCG